jgi:hypothetical protein
MLNVLYVGISREDHNMSDDRQSHVPRRRFIELGGLTAGTIGAALLAPAVAAEAATSPGSSTTSVTPQSLQAGWRWCNRCQGLFYGGGSTTGWCVLGGGHDWGGSGNYIPTYGSGTGQTGWAWCHLCQGMWYNGSSFKGRCPSGGTHSSSGSGAYIIAYGTPPSGEQPGWRWCGKCYGLNYSGNGNGYCPAGGPHDFGGSGAYYLAYG